MRFDPIFFLAAPVFVFSIVVHECAHGLAALACGDGTARERGRITLNPLPHVDVMGTIVVPGLLALLNAPALVGWGKTVPIDGAKLRDPRNDRVKVAIAGPLANVVLALVFAAIARLAPATGSLATVRELGVAGVVMNCALALFHSLPIPPLDGSWVLMRFLRLRHIIALHQLRPIAIAVVVAIALVPVTSKTLLEAPLFMAVRALVGALGAPDSVAAR